jgi:hypothetical protein
VTTLSQTIPALPVRDAARAVEFYRPASCRILVDGVDDLFGEIGQGDVLHPVSREGVTTTDFRTREFATLDLDGNLVTFFEWQRE